MFLLKTFSWSYVEVSCNLKRKENVTLTNYSHLFICNRLTHKIHQEHKKKRENVYGTKGWKKTTQNTTIRYFSFWGRRAPLTLSNHLHWPSTLIRADVSLKPCCFISVLYLEKFGRCTPGDCCEITVPSQRRITDILYSRALAQDMADWVSYKPAQTTGSFQRPPTLRKVCNQKA